MISSSEYRKRLSKMRRNIYIDGKLVDREFKRLEGAINVMAKTYDLITHPEPRTTRMCLPLLHT
jgi:4-hydroxyphenylacetate 3-monooxygenase/4-hydroxybutyryl-CoA dehydratase/vinylacetyl-CoA-Delta-isomerase